MAIETGHMRFIVCPMCAHQSVHVGSRLPTFCTECGKPVVHKFERKHILFSDPDATIRYNAASKPTIRLMSEYLKKGEDGGQENNQT